MANADLIAPMPDLDLKPGMVIQFEAIDAASGSPVAGVNVQSVTIYGAGSGPFEDTGPFMLVPGPRG